MMSRFKKCGDQSEDFRRESVDGREGVFDVLRLLLDIRDPRNRIIDLQ